MIDQMLDNPRPAQMSRQTFDLLHDVAMGIFDKAATELRSIVENGTVYADDPLVGGTGQPQFVPLGSASMPSGARAALQHRM